MGKIKKEYDCIYIYGLVDPRDDIVRYVGWTVDLSKRLKRHLENNQLKNFTYKNNWIKKLLSLNFKPYIKILEIVQLEEYAVKEQEWIKFFGRENLTNGTDGGEGIINPSKESLERARKLLSIENMGEKNPNYGKRPSLETIQKMSEAAQGENNPFFGKTHKIETIQKISETEHGIKRIPSKSKYIGLDYKEKDDMWGVRLSKDGIRYYIRSFKYEVEAALAYNEMALELWGWKAKLNDIPQEEIDKLWELE